MEHVERLFFAGLLIILMFSRGVHAQYPMRRRSFPPVRRQSVQESIPLNDGTHRAQNVRGWQRTTSTCRGERVAAKGNRVYVCPPLLISWSRRTMGSTDWRRPTWQTSCRESRSQLRNLVIILSMLVRCSSSRNISILPDISPSTLPSWAL
ncbi:hypothetical protein BJ546DRAFT_439592 [Cryomyces antarcticus]